MTFIAFVVALVFALPAYADVTVKQTMTGKGMLLNGTVPGTVYIKGSKMRSDSVMDGKTETIIFDLDAQKMLIFNSKKKEAEVWEIAALSAEVEKNVDIGSTRADFKPNGEKKQIGPHTAAGYDMAVSMYAALGGNQDMKMTVTLEGPVWIVTDVPGAADYSGFYKAAAEKGWLFSDPRVAKAQPGQAKAIAEMHKAIADVGGIPYLIDIRMKMGGTGPMAGLFGKLGNVTMTTVVESVETGPLSDSLFAPPAGYKLNSKK